MRRVLAAMILFVAIGTNAAQAQSCSFGITDLNFGNIDLTSNTTYDTTGTLSVNCSGTKRAVVIVCPNLLDGTGGSSGLNPRFLLSGSNQLNYNLYQDAARTTIWGSYPAGLFSSPTINVTLNNQGAGSGSATIYARIAAAQQSELAGTYTSSYSGAGAMTLAYAYSTGSNTCASIGSTNGTSTTFAVSATDVTQCSVSSSAVNFGTAGLLNANLDATGTVTLTCTNAAPYTVALNGGNAGATDPAQRKLASGPTQITYGLYRNSARTLAWGSTAGSDTQAGTGNGLSQSYTVYARVPPQTTPAPATYSDTVIVTLTY